MPQAEDINDEENARLTRPMSFELTTMTTTTTKDQLETPTPVENIHPGGDFFDKRITSSNEPSLDRLTSASGEQMMSMGAQESVREISNESLASYEGVKSDSEEIEAKAAIATALLFSSTIKSQSSDEVKSVSSTSTSGGGGGAHRVKNVTDEEEDEIAAAARRSSRDVIQPM